MYEHILVPTDGSEAAERAAHEAIELAETFDATVHALYVVDAAAYVGGTMGTGDGMVREALTDAGEEAVGAVADLAAAAGVECTTAVKEGSPHRTIEAHAGEVDADLLVMGTHGRSGLDHLLLGSVTERTIRIAGVPVLVVGPGEENE
jgi:nucleotide-binding universal stress UspA family protein